ncbi:hypothetical protein AVEN_205584-1 [Araneus ventricosus]|uniref:G-protein coupled receptors family 1 profile domain-containing protein n=1 Tax=Araneus ventricosus TaxID=182803 RepID=A0A4Y2F6Z9_ARAVE|nr:hypothetical protein AVEN_205584-1 [Araneus ventricosus]
MPFGHFWHRTSQLCHLASFGIAPASYVILCRWHDSNIRYWLRKIQLTSVIATAYVVAWFPYAIVCLYEAYGNPELVPKIGRILSALFCKTAAATNPIIYLFMSKGFRREVVETFNVLFKCRRRGAFSSFIYSSSLKSSSCRSPSEISLRSSWLSRVRRGSSRMRRKAQSNNSSTSETPHNVNESQV